jgi:hypothetical protein
MSDQRLFNADLLCHRMELQFKSTTGYEYYSGSQLGGIHLVFRSQKSEVRSIDVCTLLI